MTAYLTSIGMYPATNPPEQQGKRDVEPVALSNKISDGNYHLSWDIAPVPDTVIDISGIDSALDDLIDPARSSQLLVRCRFSCIESEHEEELFFHAPPYFSSEILRHKLNQSLRESPMSPSPTYKAAFNILRDEFGGFNPISMVEELRKKQEEYFLDGLRDVVAFSHGSEADQHFRRLHHVISLIMNDHRLSPFFESNPLVIHPGMEDHIYFKDLTSLYLDGHVHPINLEGFEPDEASPI